MPFLDFNLDRVIFSFNDQEPFTIGNAPVRARSFAPRMIPLLLRDFFSGVALVAELVDTQDLKSCSPQTRVRVQVPPGALAWKRLFNYWATFFYWRLLLCFGWFLLQNRNWCHSFLYCGFISPYFPILLHSIGGAQECDASKVPLWFDVGLLMDIYFGMKLVK